MSDFKPSIPSSISKPLPMVVNIIGKVEAIRRYDGNSYTRVICPAPDLYSKPAVVEIRSPKSIGARNDEIDVQARMGGYMRKPYKVTDRETGEISTITPVDLTLDFVE